jgi:hypothetical protein
MLTVYARMRPLDRAIADVSNGGALGEDVF